MNVDKMIEALEQNRGRDTYSNYDDNILDALIATLKAGQDMAYGYDKLIIQSIENRTVWNSEHSKLLHAWDAATKGEDVARCTDADVDKFLAENASLMDKLKDKGEGTCP